MSHRKMTPRGQMSRSSNTGPAVMLLPPNLRMIFGPNPPLEFIPPVSKKRRQNWTGMSSYLSEFERTPTKPRHVNPTPKSLKEAADKRREEQHKGKLEPLVEEYRTSQKDTAGEFEGMNCYNTLFIGRLAYEVVERKLLREMEQFGPVKDLKIVKDKDGKSRGYAFVEYEQEEDMKRAYRAADAMPLEGRPIVVDVERGHTVPNWLPRRLGGGLGGTRIGGKDKNVTTPGRFDPSRPRQPPPPMSSGMGRGGGGYGEGGYSRGGMDGGGRGRNYPPPPPPRGGRYDGYGGGDRKRGRSRSPDRRGNQSRRRY